MTIVSRIFPDAAPASPSADAVEGRAYLFGAFLPHVPFENAPCAAFRPSASPVPAYGAPPSTLAVADLAEAAVAYLYGAWLPVAPR
jgi:hypothetical protein